jgi:hypothetical protein
MIAFLRPIVNCANLRNQSPDYGRDALSLHERLYQWGFVVELIINPWQSHKHQNGPKIKILSGAILRLEEAL